MCIRDRTWTQVATPTPGGSAWFNGVAATSATNAWAVGYIGGGPGAQGNATPIIEHWNGKVWKRQFFRLPINPGQFVAVAATGRDNAWAVGYTGVEGPNGALIEHWNGHKWRRIPANTPDGFGNLQGVTAISPSDVWAVGYTNPACPCGTAAFRWNGKRWKVTSTVNPPDNFLDAFLGVVAISRHDVWAVGTTDWSSTIIEHWNGKSWRD